MACIAAIGIDDEQNIVANLPDGLYPDLTVIATVISLLDRGTQEYARSIIEIETALAQRASAFGLVPLEEGHRRLLIRFKRTSVNSRVGTLRRCASSRSMRIIVQENEKGRP